MIDEQDEPVEAPAPSAAGHPRPTLRRADWWSLDGSWDFAIDDADAWRHPSEVAWDGGTITVPFAPESRASGVGHRGFITSCWYRRELAVPSAGDERLVLHFGAVDHAATVWLDGALVVEHEGGYSPFSVDLTRALGDGGSHELAVRASDDPADLAKPRGKQDWELEPHSIWYERTTGIWQTVWMERVPRTSIATLLWSSDLDHMAVTADVRLEGPVTPGTHLRVRLRALGRVLVDDVLAVNGRRMKRSFVLDGTGVDRLRDSLVWTPEHPVLVDASIELLGPDGEVVDRVLSYTGIRTVGVRAGRFLLNNRPYQLRLVLDQGYWSESGLTPPSVEAVRRDIELAKALGFNGVRKHQKIEDPRWLYEADRLGLLVWEEMPPAYRFDAEAIQRTTREWLAAVERDRVHPCVVVWVPFNESTGLLGLANRQDQRDFVAGLTLLTKALDPDRPVVSNDGWETVGGDLIGVHDYEQDADRLARRWRGDLRRTILGYADHGRLQTLDEPHDGWDAAGAPARPIVLTEFGGIGWAPDAPVDRDHAPAADEVQDRLSQPAAWGYSTVASAEELLQRYRALLAAVHSSERLAGFCYTQLADTYQEVNGLLTSDRQPKAPIEEIAAATRGQGKSFFDPLDDHGGA